MTLDSIFSLLGSVASIVAIPLSVYLYLRSKEARAARVRREVVKTLSYQIGEGRDLNLFTISTVIRSRIRDEGVRDDSISVGQVVEDLVAETITEPMLDTNRKDQILQNLARLYHLGAIGQFLERYPITINQLARWAAQDYELDEEDKRLATRRAQPLEISEGIRPRRAPSISAYFGLIAIGVTLVLFAIYEKELSGIFSDIGRKIPIPELLIGTIGSLLASVLTLLVFMLQRRLVHAKWGAKSKSTDTEGPPNSGPAADR